MKFLKFSVVFLVAVALLWGGLVLLQPYEDRNIHVVLDPGHGGTDPGAVSGDFLEKDINLAIARMVFDRLEGEEGVQVSMTRDQDTSLTLSERADFANKKQADLYVSIHANSLTDPGYSGLMTFYHPDKDSSKEPAKLIHKSAVAASDAIDRNVRSEDYAVLRLTEMPAVLIETGFMTCPDELQLLTDVNYQAKLAQGIADGILAYRGK